MSARILKARLELPEILTTVPEYLEAKAKEHVKNGKTNYMVDSISGETMDFNSFETSSRKVASALYKIGVRKGDIIMYMCYDLAKLPVLFNGVWHANAALRSIYSQELEDSILANLIDAKAKFIVCEDTEAKTCLAVAKRVEWSVQVLVMGRAENCTSFYDLMEDDGKACPKLDITHDDTALIFSTSGTTGRSKGAVHKHRSITAALQRSSYMMNFTYDKPNIYVSRAPHMSGSMFGITCVAEGLFGIAISRVTPENFFAAIDKYKPGFIFSFPTYLISLLNDPRAENIDKSSIENIVTGGVTVNASLAEELYRKLPNFRGLCIAYACTECILCSSHVEALEEGRPRSLIPERPMLSIGKVCPGTEIQIRDIETGKPLGPNKTGEICLKSPTGFSYYHNQEEETKKAFTEDGYFRSGDSGYYDKDEFIFFVDRLKDMLKCNANHISPAELDEVISRHTAVAEVCTVGVLDVQTGEKLPRAFVILKSGATATADEIKEFAHAILPVYKHLTRGLYIVEDLPRGTTGKISRQLVEKLPIPK